MKRHIIGEPMEHGKRGAHEWGFSVDITLTLLIDAIGPDSPLLGPPPRIHHVGLDQPRLDDASGQKLVPGVLLRRPLLGYCYCRLEH
ncbi:hypothetical protein [Mycolicibacter terrae]|uniref:hypothetical protein n=1 Tax=Mycolicibacter terrae TaxID=1788 RepID=UPI0023DEA139|nr:hypothetical protein [Mycolicibacter terrae]